MSSSFVLRPYFVILAFVISHSLGAQQPYKKAISVGEPPPDHSPEAELASFKVLDGFEVNLFASEKDKVPNPLVIRWDERGRLWVLSTTAYPQPAPDEVCNDQVLILEDTDHDGRADKRTVYADGLRMPMGMELAGPGELYVGEGEKLWLFKDTNGDDQVDEKEVIFSGFGTGDTHQNINSFIWSPDGALVMHQGLHCYSRVTTAWGVKQLYGAGFWRFWPRSRKLEAYPTGMPLNPWGTAFTKEGQPIMVAGAAGMFWARPMEIEVPELPRTSASPSTNKETEGLPYFLLGRFMLPHSGQIIKTDGLRKFCGVDIVGNAHWPNEMQEEIITGGFFENAIYRHKLRDDPEAPSGFEAIEQPPLITSSSVAFRPVDVRFGPEGALYIADWYDPIIGHYQASFRHPNRDKRHGRIWRVTVKGKPSVKYAVFSGDWAKMTDANSDERTRSNTAEKIAEIAKSADRWTAYQSTRLLRNLPFPKQALEAVTWRLGSFDFAPPTLPKNPTAEQRKHVEEVLHRFEDFSSMEFLWILRCLEAFERVSEHMLSNVLAARRQPELRAQATHTVGSWAHKLPNTLELLSVSIADESPRVRLEAIVACAKVKSPEAIMVALKALDKPMDTFLDRALWLAVHATAPQWKKAETLDAFLASLPSKHLAYLVEKEGSAELLGTVRTMVAEKGDTMPPETRHVLMGALLKKGEPADMLRALKLGQTDQVILEELAAAATPNGFKTPAEAETILSELLLKGTAAQKIAACQLAGAWQVRGMIGHVRDLLKANEKSRAPALTALARLGEPATTFQAFVADARQPWSVRIAALTALTNAKPALAGSEAAKPFGTITDAGTMRAWLTPLLARETAMTSFAKALEAASCSPDTAKLALTTLTAAGRSDAALTAVFNKILGVKNTLPAYSADWVAELAAEVKASGDAAKGKAVFAAPLSGCMACHQVGKIGGIIGPELDGVGRGVPVELLIEAVVWPQRQIKEGYIATSLTLKDGRKLQGYKISEGAADMQLKDLLTGTIGTLNKADITARQESGSLMPEGLILNMTRAELRDLVAYLTGLGK